MSTLPMYTEYCGETKIALLDNSSIAFMEKLERRGISTRLFLSDYDLILVPSWVMTEVLDSQYRVNHLLKLSHEGYPVYTIQEASYSELVDGKEYQLYRIVYAAVSRIGAMKGYLRRNVEKEDPLDMAAYEEWITAMYQDWPLSQCDTASGRSKKKNAGEISLTILSEIFSWYYPDVDTVTVYTQDRDAFEFQTAAHDLLSNELFKGEESIAVTYKSNDFLFAELYQKSLLTLDEIFDLRDDARKVVFTQMHSDGTTALLTKRLDNSQFVALLQDETSRIIF